MSEEKRRSGLWYLLPIFFGIIGGVIAYFVIKQDDPSKAKNCLYLGLVLLLIDIVAGYWWVSLGFLVTPEKEIVSEIIEKPTIIPASPIQEEQESASPVQEEQESDPVSITQDDCDSSYPDVCIASYPPDLDCDEIGYSNFRVVGDDQHGFDMDNDGIGCEVGLPFSSNTVESVPECDESYPDVCIAPYPPDLDCGEIGYSNFKVVGSDPHGFDGDKDGIGCES